MTKSGRFINQKLADRRNKASTNKKENDEENMENLAEFQVGGRRAVDVSLLCQRMWCRKCKKALCFQNI